MLGVGNKFSRQNWVTSAPLEAEGRARPCAGLKALSPLSILWVSRARPGGSRRARTVERFAPVPQNLEVSEVF